MNNEGELTPNCIDESNLTESETQIAQETFKNHRLNLIELIKKNTKTLNQTDATKQGALRIITVKSFPDEGAKAFENLLQGLKTSLGASKAEKVLSGYPALSLYFSYGCQDVKIKVFDAPDVPGTVTDLSEVEVTTNDPVTGQQLTQGRHTFGTLNRIYDDAFFVPQK